MTAQLTSLLTWVLASAANRSHQIVHARLAEAGVTGYEYRCVSALAAVEQLSQTELGAAAALDPRDVTLTVRALEGRGIVSRAKDPSHGRRQLVSLTDAGRRLAAHLSDAMVEIQDDVFRRISDEDRAILSDLLERVGRP